MWFGQIFKAALALSITEALLINATYFETASLGSVGAWIALLFLPNLFIFVLYNVLIFPNYVDATRDLPGPKNPNLFLGWTLRLWGAHPPGDPYREWLEDIPNDGLIRYRDLFGLSGVLVTSAAALRTVLVDNEEDWRKPQSINETLRKVLGNGLILSEGDAHKFQRKHLMPSFQVNVIRGLYPLFWKKSCELVQMLEEETTKPEFELGVWCTRVTLDIIGLGLGHDFNSLKRPDDPFVKMYQELLEPDRQKTLFFVLSIIFNIENVMLIPFWQVVKSVDRISKELHNFAYGLAKARRAELNDAKMSAEEKDKRMDILSLLIKSNDFSDQELGDQILTFLAAGHETTANTVTWVMFCLAQKPDMMRELRAEIRANLPSPDSVTETISPSTIDNMPLLTAVCNETLRLFPVVPVTSREAVRDTALAGRIIRKNHMVEISIWAINRNSHLWGKDANEFVPQRWINADGKVNNTGGAASNYDLLTFLHGPRSCIGQGFAKSELKCLVAALAGRYDVEITRDIKQYYPAGIVTAKAANGMWLKFTEVPGW